MKLPDSPSEKEDQNENAKFSFNTVHPKASRVALESSGKGLGGGSGRNFADSGGSGSSRGVWGGLSPQRGITCTCPIKFYSSSFHNVLLECLPLTENCIRQCSGDANSKLGSPTQPRGLPQHRQNLTSQSCLGNRRQTLAATVQNPLTLQ